VGVNIHFKQFSLITSSTPSIFSKTSLFQNLSTQPSAKYR